MTEPGRGSRRIWSADEIEEQLDELAEVLIRGAGEFVKGLFFGGPSRPQPKPEKPRRRQS